MTIHNLHGGFAVIPVLILIALMCALGAGIYFIVKSDPQENTQDKNQPPPVKNSEGKPISRCIISGCNGELCIPEPESPLSSICVYRPEHACYKNARCEIQPDGNCGWTKTTTLDICLEQSK